MASQYIKIKTRGRSKVRIAQMSVGADMLKDIAKADSAMSKACYYDSKHDTDEYRKY